MINNRMQSAIIIIITMLSVLSFVLPFMAYCVTRNWVTLVSSVTTFPLGFIWTWIIKRVFPLNQQDHERELVKVMYSNISINKKQKPY